LPTQSEAEAIANVLVTREGKTMCKCRLVVAVAAALTVMILGPEATLGAVHASGQIELYATGLDASLQENVLNGSQLLRFSGETKLLGEGLVYSYGYGFTPHGPGLAEFYSAGDVGAAGGKIGAAVWGTGGGGWYESPTAGGKATVAWEDGLGLSWRGSGDPPALPGAHLVFTFRQVGLLQVVDLSAAYSTANFYSKTFGGSAQQLDYYVISTYYNPPGTSKTFGIDVVHTGTLELDNNRRGTYRYDLTTGAGSDYGSAVAAFGTTMTLTSITFADGTTPESRGFDLVFDSGIQSPNLTAIPEPRTLIVWSLLGASGVGIGWWRRRRKA
jgi:hypothetical protein